MRYTVIVLFITLLASCSNSFINHELKAERIGECTQQPSPVKMISNINGERYEFEYCLDEGFDGEKYLVERKGDSLIVSFAKSTAKNYHLKKYILQSNKVWLLGSCQIKTFR